MNLSPVLINGKWREARNPVTAFYGVNPKSGKRIESYYPVSCFDEIKEALHAAKDAVLKLASTPPEKRAHFLELHARKIEERKEELTTTAALETGLPEEPRLASVELPRTTDQLRQAAAAVRKRDWCQATIDTSRNIRSKYDPLGGAVIILGPNNFPLAFNSVTGGDFAAAIAAGNPVLAKANPGHPGTSKILAEAAFEAVEESGLPYSSIQMFYHCTEKDGYRIITHPFTAAISFTGSGAAGLKLKEAAESCGKLIYLEMSSVNPLFILPGALKERKEEIASDFFNSCTLGTGQFCTKPGLVVLAESKEAEEFISAVSRLLSSQEPGFLLGEGVLKEIREKVKLFKFNGAEVITGGSSFNLKQGFRFKNTLLLISGSQFLTNPLDFQEEIFGPVSLFVLAESTNQMTKIAHILRGNLTASIFSAHDGSDEQLYRELEPVLRFKAGRLLNDKMPTGVAVSPAMTHGGPFPATGHPGFTSVGIPFSFLRFAARHCYDNVRQDRLPPELKDKNPTGLMWRYIDGEWTQRSL
ncbi:MAG: aldehyde dehydrogenase family protein [Acidobacteriota bacterium]